MVHKKPEVKLTASQLAKDLNGINILDYGIEQSDAAEENGLVVVYAYDEDTLSFSGVWDSQVLIYQTGILSINKDGPIYNQCECEDCPYHEQICFSAKHSIEVGFNYRLGIVTELKVSVPYSTFRMHDDGKELPNALVFSVDDL